MNAPVRQELAAAAAAALGWKQALASRSLGWPPGSLPLVVPSAPRRAGGQVRGFASSPFLKGSSVHLIGNAGGTAEQSRRCGRRGLAILRCLPGAAHTAAAAAAAAAGQRPVCKQSPAKVHCKHIRVAMHSLEVALQA